MMNPTIETSLYENLSPFFSRKDFLLLRDKKQFRRTTNIGFQNIILSPIFNVNDTLLAVNFGCRNNQVEHIAQQFLNTSPELRVDANTLNISIGRFDSSTQFCYKIQTENELSSVCYKIERFFDQRGFDFMTSACTLPVLDQLLNELSDYPCPYVYNQIHRCYKGIIAARLNYNPHFDGLVDRYRHLLVNQTNNPYEQLHFEKLVAYLKHYYSNN